MHLEPLFSADLDWLHPSLSDAAPDKDLSKALKQIRTHLRSLKLPLPRLDLCGDLQAQSEGLMQRRVQLLNEDTQLETPLNWHVIAQSFPQRNWHLGYMYWINPLAWSYEQSGDPRYARQWKTYVEEFVDGCPYAEDPRGYWPTRDMLLNDKQTCNLGENGGERHAEARPEQQHQWMSLSCHFRIDTWLAGLSRMADSPELDDAFLMKVLLSLTRDHAFVAVMNPRENTPNQFTAITLSLMRLAVTLPMFRSHAAHFQVAWERLQRVFSNTMYVDGSDAEQSPNYNMFLLDLCVELLDLLEEAPESRKTPIRAAAKKRLAFLEAIQTPDGQLPPIAKGHLEPLAARLAEARQALGLPPREGALRSAHFPYGGYHVLRGDSSWLLFKCSSAGNGHMHEDALSLQLWVQGEEVLSDPSHYTYDMGTEEERELNNWALSSASHNTLLVGNEGQRRLQLRHSSTWNHDEIPPLRAAEAPLQPFRIQGTEQIRFLEGVYADGYPAAECVEHRRQILELSGLGWLILDWLSEDVDASRCWHLAPRLQGQLQIEADRIYSPGFQMLNLTPGCDQEIYPRFHFPDYAIKVPATEVRWSGSASADRPLLTWMALHEQKLPVDQQEQVIHWGEFRLELGAELRWMTPLGTLSWEREQHPVRFNDQPLPSLL